MPGALTRQASLLTISRSLGQVLNVLAGMLIVRALTQFDYGTYRQVTLLYTTLYLMGDAAFAQSLYHFIPRQREQARIFLGQALVVALGMSALWTVGLLGLGSGIVTFFGNPQLAPHMLLLAAYLTLSLLAKIPEAGLITLERTAAVSVNIAVFEGLKFVLVLGALKWNASITWLLAAMVAATALRLMSLLQQMRSEIDFAVTAEFPEQLRHSMALWLPGILNSAAIYAHQYIVGFYFTPADYAIYAVACFQVPFMGVLASSLNEVFLVRAARYAGEERHAEIYQLWMNACRKALLLYLPATVGLAVLARPLIVFFNTARYAEAAPLFIVILLGLPFSGLFQDGMFRAYAAMRTYAFFYVLRVVLAIGLGVAGVKFLGLWGAAVSGSLAVFILNAAQLVKVAQLLKVSYARVLPWKDIGKMTLTSVAAAFPAMLCAELITQPFLALAAGIPVYAVTYLLLAQRIGLVSGEEIESLLGGARAGFERIGLMRAKANGSVVVVMLAGASAALGVWAR